MVLHTLTRILVLAHGAYLLVGGLWPLLHMTSFEEVTGPKEEDWLVRSVAGMLVVTGVVLLAQVRKQRVEVSAVAVAMGASLTLGAVGIITAAEGVIDPIYIGDGTVHIVFVALWCGAIVNGAVRGRSNWMDLPQRK
jgi:hypothetical protein